MTRARCSRRAVLALVPATALAACGGTTPATSSPAVVTPTPRPISTIMVTVRTGSAVIPSPTGQSAAAAMSAPTAPPAGTLAPTVPVPALRTGVILPPLMGGMPYTTSDGKATLRYPADWDVQAGQDAAQFAPRNAAPTDPNVPRVTFIGQPVQLDLLSGDNAMYYTQSIAQQSTERGAMNLVIRQLEQVTLGDMKGLPALKIVAAYTTTMPVVSLQVITQSPTSERTYFLSATAPASDYDTKWAAVIDGIAGSLIAR